MIRQEYGGGFTKGVPIVSEKKPAQLHDNGTVTYWSEVQQCWVRRTSIVPESELAGMPPEEREKIEKHLESRWQEE